MKSQTSLIAYIQEMLGEDFNIALFLSIVRKNLIWVLLLVLTACTGVFLYLRYTIPTYEASSMLMLKRERSLRSELMGVKDVLATSFEEASMEIQLLGSKYFVHRVISKLPFDISYYKEGRTKLVSSELYTATPFTVQVLQIKDPIVYGKEFYIEMLNDKTFILRYSFENQSYREILSYDKFFETPLFEINVSISPAARANLREHLGKTYFFRINDLNTLAEEIASRITIVPIDPKTKTIQIKYQDKNKTKAMDLVNALAAEFVVFDVERQAESADQILAFLDTEIDTFSQVLRNYQDTLKQYRLAKKFMDPAQEMTSLISGLRSLEQQKLSYMFDLRVIDWFYNYIGNLTDLDAISSGLLGSELSDIKSYISTIKSLERQKDQMLLNVSPEHPNVRLLEDDILKVKNEMLNDLDNIVVQKNYRLQMLDEQYQRYLTRLLLLPEEQEEYARLQQRYQELWNYYKLLTDKQSEYRLAKAGMVSDYIVLNTASVPEDPIGPPTAYLWGIAITVGLMLGFLLIVVRYLLHDAIITVDTIHKHSKASVLGIVPTVFEDIPVSGIVVTQNPKSVITEAFRVLRNNLQFIDNSPGPKTIAVTSTISGEGKTFISINIAAILSLLDKRVIIVDVDMRRPRLSKIFNVDNSSGMSTILIGRDKVEDCIRKTELRNVDFITSGPIPPNPAELILSHRLEESLDYLKTKYDYIIFDTPPLGLVTDGFEVIKKVDYPIYVFRAEYSSKTFIANVNKLIEEKGIKRLSVILNDVGRGVSGYHYGGYSYRYSYSYGYMYTYMDSGYYTSAPPPKKSFLKKLFGKS
ncbi:MAG: tyrosine protein kinase [Chitinophagales bacterium]|nr:MAG: tyrosine protein kinase [Chitinophagales bacterium]